MFLFCCLKSGIFDNKKTIAAQNRKKDRIIQQKIYNRYLFDGKDPRDAQN